MKVPRAKTSEAKLRRRISDDESDEKEEVAPLSKQETGELNQLRKSTAMR